MTDIVTVTYDPDWRSKDWYDYLPNRPAWFVTCTEHPKLGKDKAGEPWGYAMRSIAESVATKHRRAFHDD